MIVRYYFPWFLGLSAALNNFTTALPPVKNPEVVEQRPWESGWLTPENSFEFSLECGLLDYSDCSKAQQILKSAGIRIANEILFREQINVRAEFVVLDKTDFATCSISAHGN